MFRIKIPNQAEVKLQNIGNALLECLRRLHNKRYQIALSETVDRT